MAKWRRYLRFFGPNVAADVDDELQFHLEMRIRDYERHGLSRGDAERAARERFGDVGAIARQLRAHDQGLTRGTRRRDHLASVRQDLRLAARAMRRSPGWTVAVVLTLALGIGLSTAVFAIADTVLVRPLPVRDQGRLLVLWGVTRDGRTDHFPLLYRDAREYARTTRTLDRVAFFAYGGAQAVPIDLAAGATRMRRSLVSGNYFAVLGTRPLLGRALAPGDDRIGAAPVAVLSYAAWQRFFGGDSTAIGRRFALHWTGTTYTVVGVMPRGLDYPRGVDFWSPVVPNSRPLGDQPIYAELNVIGRLGPHATVAAARDELTRFFGAVGPRWNVIGVARPFTDDVLGDVGPAVLAFAAAAALLLLMACINVANLLLVRGMARAREIAVRAAIGATRRRVVAQLLVECGLLAATGGAIGMLLAGAAVRAFVLVAPAGTPRLDEIHVGASLLGAAGAVTALAMVLSALGPTFVGSRADLEQMLRAGARQSGGTRGMRVGMHALVVSQMALALVVLCAAGLLLRTLAALERSPVTIDPRRTLVVDLAFPPAYMQARSGAMLAAIDRIVKRIDAVPGVRGAAPSFTAPLAASGGVFGRINARGESADDAARNPIVDFEPATPDYFAVVGSPLISGRSFTDADREGALPVVIVSESVARHYWPNESAIGKRLERGPADLLTVVGVVRDTHYRDLRAPRPTIYYPLRQSPDYPIAPSTLIIRTNAGAAAIAPEIRRAVVDAVPGVTVAGAAGGDTFMDAATAEPKLNALLLALFACAAVTLAAVGLFGVMATSVRQRTRELGVRVALGATPRDLRRTVLRHALSLAGIGLAVGVAGSIAVTRTLGSLMFDVSPTDAPTFLSATALVLVVALGASYLPARRAGRTDPMLVLRSD